MQIILKPGEQIPTIYEMQKQYIRQVLRLMDGNKTATAKVLDIDRRTLYRQLERFAEDEE